MYHDNLFMIPLKIKIHNTHSIETKINTTIYLINNLIFELLLKI